MFETDLRGAELTGAKLDDANLSGCKAAGACFGNASLSGANLFGADLSDATFSGANLERAELRTANLASARLLGANLSRANFENADLTDAVLRGSGCEGAIFDRCELSGACLRDLTESHSARWIESRITNVDFCGAYLLRRHILDQNYLHEFRNRSRVHRSVYALWWLTSDCGRSLLRWGACIAVMVFAFGMAYVVVDVDYGSYQTWLSPFYYSMVTLTSLGYGDVLPASPAAQAVAMTEVALGYMMLGGMLSIFADKMARRAG